MKKISRGGSDNLYVRLAAKKRDAQATIDGVESDLRMANNSLRLARNEIVQKSSWHSLLQEVSCRGALLFRLLKLREMPKAFPWC